MFSGKLQMTLPQILSNNFASLKGPGVTGCGKLGISGEIGSKGSSVAKVGIDSDGFMRGLKPPPPSDGSFSAACKARYLVLHRVRHD